MKLELVQKFIAESKHYLAEASPEQKAKYIQLLERAQRELETSSSTPDANSDFLEEK